VIGSNVNSIGKNSIVLGTNGSSIDDASTDNAMAVGQNVIVVGNNTAAFGSNIVATGVNNVVLGNASSDDSRTNVVSVGSGAAGATRRQIINLAAGTKGYDAVNVSQLKGVTTALGGGADINATTGAVTTPTFKLAGSSKTYTTVAAALADAGAAGPAADAMLWNGTDAYTAKHGGTTDSKIKDLAAGAVSATSTEAINGSQLYGVANSTAAALGGGSKVDPATGAISAPEYTVDGKKVSGVEAAVTGLDGRITGVDTKVTEITNNIETLSQDALMWNDKAAGGAAYDAARGGTDSRITGVADAKEDNDAINKKQLTAAIKSVDGKVNPLAVSYDSDKKDVLTLGMDAVTGKAGPAVKLTNVAAGTGDTDAVNFGQLKATGLVDPTGKTLDAVVYDADSAKASVTFGGASGTVLNNVADGLIATGSRQAVNGGQLYKMQSDINTSISNLNNSITNIDNRVTNIEENGGGGTGGKYISVQPRATDASAPTPANAGSTPGIAVGYSASASGDNASAMGDHAVAQGSQSLAVGNNATATEGATNSVALGNGSVANSANTVSVGSAGHERTISNVARGTADTDVATLGQVNDALTEAKSYTDTRLNDAWQGLGDQIDEVNRQANRGIAAASALINVTPYVPGHTTVNAGVASYRGEAALGVGVSRWSENGRVNLNAGVSAAQDDEPVFRVGIGYIF